MSPTPGENSPAFLDATCLVNFAVVHRLDMLKVAYAGRCGITAEVLREIDGGISRGHDYLRAIRNMIDGTSIHEIMLSAAEKHVYTSLLEDIGSGEASCIAAAESRGGIVVTDDWKARVICQERGIRLSGTVGTLKACVLEDILTLEEADGILTRMVALGFFSPVHSIREVPSENDVI